MEAGGDSKSNVDLGASHVKDIDQPSSPLTEQEHGSTHKDIDQPPSPLTEQEHGSTHKDIDQPPSPLTEQEHGSTYKDNDQPPSPLTEQEHGSTYSNHLGKDEVHITSSLNTIKDDTNNNSSNTCTVSNSPGEIHSSTNDIKGLDSQPASSTSDSDVFQETDKNIDNDTHSLELASETAKSTSDGDVQTSSIPKNEDLHDLAEQEQESTSISPSQNKGAEVQNPQVQVMERTNESGANSQYVFPSHVFARNSTNAPVEWSTASNESLFSIYMGNMSFSSELACFKSGELDKPGDVYVSDPPNTSPNQQPSTPVNKFNDISQRTAELHEEGLNVTEAKAAETMREVIMESQTTDNTSKVEDEDKKSKSRRQSDGSTRSYAFQTSTGRDKSASSKGSGEKQTSYKKADSTNQTKAVDSTPKSNTNPTPNSWLNCFSCCTFCQ